MNVPCLQLRNITCPIRHYFTIVKTKSTNLFKPATLGHIVHNIYAKALKERNFNFVTPEYTQKMLLDINSANTNSNMYNLIKEHIHTSIFKKIPKKISIENQHTVVTNKLPHIANEVVIYNKPDITYIQKNVCTVCELKTGSYKKYDPMQLHYYAWGLSLNNNKLDHFVMKVFYTANNTMEVINLFDREELQLVIDRYLESSCKAYDYLGIKNVKEVSSILPTLVATDSEKLTGLFNIIHPEQCASCNSSIICPAYLQEVIHTFEQKMSNVTVSDKLIQVKTN